MLVEDSEDLVDIWERLFRASGYQITGCYDCKSALALLRAGERYDIVLSDYYLPDFNGLVLFDHLRDLSPETPFLLVTGTREAFIAEHIERGGFASLVGKPVQFKSLLSKINEYCA